MGNPVLKREDLAKVRVVGHVDLPQQPAFNAVPHAAGSDDFLEAQAGLSLHGELLGRELSRINNEINELRRENRWRDILVLIHPVQEKWPELHEKGMTDQLVLDAAFALGRCGKHDEAMAVVRPLTGKDSDNVMAWYSLGYNAYEALYTMKRERSIMPPAHKRKLLEEAHLAFKRCQQLRPDSVSFYYREAMMFKDFEDKPRQAIPLFSKAVENYEVLSAEEKNSRNQQRPKYIRALYHCASCLLKIDQPARAMQLLERVMVQDGQRNYLSLLFKHYAMGKVHFALGQPKEGLEHLETALATAEKQPVDFVLELAARCALLLDKPEKAERYLKRIPAKRKRPYICWTEADVLLRQGRFKQAITLLEHSAERDRRSRHKTLVRIARIHLSNGRYEEACRHAVCADQFCVDNFGNGFNEAKFWQAASLYRMAQFDEAAAIVDELTKRNFSYPNFRRLARALAGQR